MRRVEDAIYWLLYLDGFPATEKLDERRMRFRLARRILIGSAEDGHSISVMEKVASNFKHLCEMNTPVVDLAAEIVGICKLPNWWDPATGGHDYLHASLIGHRKHVLYKTIDTEEAATALARQGIESRDRVTALGGLYLLSELRIGSTRQAEFLKTIAQGMDHERALRLLNVHLGARTALAGDNNFTAHAVWWLAGGESPVADDIEPVSTREVSELVEYERERWKDPQPIPNCYCDGIHCAGNDRRYAGLLPDMYAVCLAFQKYGNIEPENPWLPDFYPTDGLEIVP